MAEQKAKPATKKTTAAKAGSTVASKPKATKAKAVPKAKVAPKVQKVAAKKTAVLAAKPKITKAPAAKKSPAPAVEKKVAVKKTATTKKNLAAQEIKETAAKPTPEERYRMIQTAAYFMAEHHGFSGNSMEHWAAAEAEIARKLGERI